MVKLSENILYILAFLCILTIQGCSALSPTTEYPKKDFMNQDPRLVEYLRDYKEKPGSIPNLPPTAERRLLEVAKSSRIIDIREIVYSTTGGGIYLGVSASYEIDWSTWESVFHHSYILEKESDESSWEAAKVYTYNYGEPIIYEVYPGKTETSEVYSLIELFALPYEGFLKALHEWKHPENLR